MVVDADRVEAPKRTLGILALQGAFEEHEAAFGQLPEELLKRVRVAQVRKAKELDACDALVIPGGETTTMKIIGNDNSDSIMDHLKSFIHGGEGTDGVSRPPRPVWGTCAGCILLCDDVVNSLDDKINDGAPSPKRCKYGSVLGGLPATTCRNFFGRQAESFEAPVSVEAEASAAEPKVAAGREAFTDFPAVFIRGPAILDVRPGARVLARVQHPASPSPEGVVVAAESERLLVTCFHPELAQDSRVHKYFVEHFVLA